MRSLRAWLGRFLGSWAEGRKPRTPAVTRFVISESHYWKKGGFRLKPAAFLPRRTEAGRWELSVFRTNGLVESQVWTLGNDHVVPTGRRLHGRGDLAQGSLVGMKPDLRLDLDETPPRHANLLGWPQDEDEQLAIAQELSTRAQSFRAPTP